MPNLVLSEAQALRITYERAILGKHYQKLIELTLMITRT